MKSTTGRLLALFTGSVFAFSFCWSVAAAQEGQPPTGEPQEPPTGEPQEPPAQEPPKPEDEKPKELTKEEAKAMLDAFKKAYNATMKDERARAEAVETLEGALHPNIMALLGNLLLNDKSEKVREAAAEALGSMMDKRVVPFLDKGVSAAANRKKYGVWQCIFGALGKIADTTCVLPLLKFVKSNTAVFEKDIQGSVTSAIDALAEIKHVSAIDGLIKSFELIGVKDSLIEDEQKSIYDTYASAYCRSLSGLTGQNFTTQLEWNKWWQKNAKTFKFETPEEEKKDK